MPDHRASNQPLTPDERDLLQEWWDSGCEESLPIPEVTSFLGQKPDARNYLEQLDRLDQELKHVFSFRAPADTQSRILQGVAGMLDAESEFRNHESKSDARNTMQRLLLFAGMAAGLLLMIGLFQLIWIRSYGPGQLVKGPSRMFDSISSSLSVAAEQEEGRERVLSESEESFKMKRAEIASKPADELASGTASPSVPQPEMEAEHFARTRASGVQRPLGQAYSEPPAAAGDYSSARGMTQSGAELRAFAMNEDKGAAPPTVGEEIAADAVASDDEQPFFREYTKLNFEPLAFGLAGGTGTSPADAPQLVARSSQDWLLRLPASEEAQWNELEVRLKTLREQSAQTQVARDVARPIKAPQFPGIDVREGSNETGHRWLLKGTRAEIVRLLAAMGVPLFREAPKDGVSVEGQPYGYFSWDFKERSVGEDVLSTTDLRSAFAGSPDDVVQLEIRLDQN